MVYITGDSGSGKSVLLRAIEVDLGGEAANIDEVGVDRDTPIVDTVGRSFKEALGLLSRGVLRVCGYDRLPVIRVPGCVCVCGVMCLRIMRG